MLYSISVILHFCVVYLKTTDLQADRLHLLFVISRVSLNLIPLENPTLSAFFQSMFILMINRTIVCWLRINGADTVLVFSQLFGGPAIQFNSKELNWHEKTYVAKVSQHDTNNLRKTGWRGYSICVKQSYIMSHVGKGIKPF